MSFNFIPTPTGQGLDDVSFVTSALDQPMSLGSTFWDQAKGGVLSSFGLGTAIRAGSLPGLARDTTPDGLDIVGSSGFDQTVDPSMLPTPSGAMTEDEYKASPDFRKDIPFQRGMTPDRAGALAAMNDAAKVREFYAQKRPVTAFLGSLAGSATDPINYIPIAGEAVAAANVARFGRVAGRAVTGALDAAANTALAGITTSPIREQFGDDVSWQSTVSQIAMAGLIGGAFGAIHGRFGRDASPDLHAEANDKLSTLDNVQQARVALNDALDGMINQSEVNISPASADFVARAADQEIPKVAIGRMAREADPAAFDRLDTLNNTFSINDAEIRRLQGLSLDNEKYGATRAAMMDANALGDKLDSIQQAIDRAPNDKERAVATARLETTRKQLRDKLSGIDDQKVQEIEDIEQRLAARRAVNEPVVAERQQLQQRVDQLHAQARDQYWKDRFAQPAQAAQAVPDDINGPVVGTQDPTLPSPPATAQRASVNTTSLVEAPDPAVTAATKRVGKPEATREMAEQYRVNPETGEFPEMADIQQLEAEGKLTPEDQAILDDADETVKTAGAYAEALKAFARCAI